MNREDRIERGRQAEQALEFVGGAIEHIRDGAVREAVASATPEAAWDQLSLVRAIDELSALLHDYVRTGNNDVKLAEQEQQRAK